MTRQETVIKITKITRIVGEMKSQLDLDDEIEFEALDSSWTNIGKWAEEICQYMEQAPSPLLVLVRCSLLLLWLCPLFLFLIFL